MAHDRTKHIEIKFHYVRSCVEAGLIKCSYVSTKENIADILSKGLPKSQHEFLVSKLLGLQEEK